MSAGRLRRGLIFFQEAVLRPLRVPQGQYFIARLALGVVAIAVIIHAIFLYNSYQQHIALQKAHLADLANAAEGKISGSFRSINTLMRHIAERVRTRDGAGDKDLRAYLVQALESFPEIKSLEFINKQGIIKLSTRKDREGLDDSSNITFINAYRQINYSEFYLSSPEDIGETYSGVLYAGFPVQDDFGKFSGAIVVSLDIDFFNRIVAEIIPPGERNSAAFVNWKGEILARWPEPEKYFGMNISSGVAFTAHLLSGKPLTLHQAVAETDGVEKLIAARSLERKGLPALIVFATRSIDDVLRPWWQDAVISESLFVCLLVVITLFAGIAAYREKKLLEVQKDLAEKENLYHTLFLGCKAVALLIDPENGAIIDANAAAEAYYGWPRAALLQLSITDINTLTRDEVVEEMARAKAERRNQFFFRHRLASGAVRDVAVHSGPVSVQGRVLLYSIVHDITDSRRAEAELRVTAARLKLVMETAAEGIIGVDDESRITFANRAAGELLGWGTVAVMQGLPSSLALGHRLANGHPCHEGLCAINKTLDDGETRRVPNEYFSRTDQSVFPVEYVVSALRVEGIVVGAALVFRDISERRAQEQEVQRLLSFRRSLLDAAGNAIIATDTDASIILFNPTAEKWLGYTAAEMVGQATPLAFHDLGELQSHLEDAHPDIVLPKADHPDYIREMAKRVVVALARTSRSTGIPDAREWTYIRKDGSRFPVLLSVSAVYDDEHRLSGYLGLAQDISAIKAMENSLRRSNEELEQFAYVASHDLRQPLRMVAGYLGIIERRLKASLDSELQGFFGYAIDGARQMDVLIHGLLEYSRVGRVSRPFVPVSLETLIKACLENHQDDITTIRAMVTVGKDFPTLLGDDLELARLLENLFSNAVKYRAEDRLLRLSIDWRPEGGGFVLWFRDNGIGIDPKDHERAFGMFQRLAGSENRSGTGIGLAICRKIVEHHGGRIWIESAPDAGSCFFMAFPKREQ